MRATHPGAARGDHCNATSADKYWTDERKRAKDAAAAAAAPPAAAAAAGMVMHSDDEDEYLSGDDDGSLPIVASAALPPGHRSARPPEMAPEPLGDPEADVSLLELGTVTLQVQSSPGQPGGVALAANKVAAAPHGVAYCTTEVSMVPSARLFTGAAAGLASLFTTHGLRSGAAAHPVLRLWPVPPRPELSAKAHLFVFRAAFFSADGSALPKVRSFTLPRTTTVKQCVAHLEAAAALGADERAVVALLRRGGTNNLTDDLDSAWSVSKWVSGVQAVQKNDDVYVHSPAFVVNGDMNFDAFSSSLWHNTLLCVYRVPKGAFPHMSPRSGSVVTM